MNGQKKVGIKGSTISFMITIMVKVYEPFLKTEKCVIWNSCLFKEIFLVLQGDYNLVGKLLFSNIIQIKIQR